MDKIELLQGDCLHLLPWFEDNSVDSVVTDPPYGLAFMGKKWDYQLPSLEIWKEVFRVLKPGGYLLAFGGPRTYHRMACGVEDAGFEVRDQLQWLFGSGFPKSLDVSKAIDKAAGAERAIVGYDASKARPNKENFAKRTDRGGATEDTLAGWKDNGATLTAPSTDAAKQWSGWGTALKPANEPILLARKPLSEKTVAANVLKWGTGGINVDGCRVEGKPRTTHAAGNFSSVGERGDTKFNMGDKFQCPEPTGRFPANLILDETAAEMLDAQSGEGKSAGEYTKSKEREIGGSGSMFGNENSRRDNSYAGDTGGASRFFYVAKASKREKNAGLERACTHPTVKPIRLMRYLCRLITPPNGVVLDPFLGSGSTGIAALKEGFGFIGIEREKEYFSIAEKRIAAWNR